MNTTPTPNESDASGENSSGQVPQAFAKQLRALAHDLNNQLFVVHGNAELLGRPNSGLDPKELAGEIRQAAVKAREIGEAIRQLCRQASSD